MTIDQDIVTWEDKMSYTRKLPTYSAWLAQEMLDLKTIPKRWIAITKNFPCHSLG